MAKKILLVDDSALMRRVLCDIINSDERFQVVDKASNGLEAFDYLSRNTYDAVVLDVNMPKMNGLELLKELRKFKIPARVMMASTDTREGARTTMDALELGALDFVHKPENAFRCRENVFREGLLQTLYVVSTSKPPVFESAEQLLAEKRTTSKMVNIISKSAGVLKGKKVVAIASSTGGPKALQSVIPRLPANLAAPVLLVQHMPKGFTASMAERLNELSDIGVKEAAEGDELKDGMVYVARGGSHMTVKRSLTGAMTIHYTDAPPREGVRPCANYMFESLADTDCETIVGVVMTGMGADATEGIKNLKAGKKTYVIAQDQETCTVFGMPKSVIAAGLSDQVTELDQIAQEIILHVGIK